MSEFSRNNILNSIERVSRLNADSLCCEDCYYTCANKYKLDELMRHENQVIFGRRGTGKTTIFKAFNYYVNNINKDKYPNVSCWYARMDQCIPNYNELEKDISLDDIVTYCIRKFLTGFVEFLCQEYDIKEKKHIFLYNSDLVSDKLLYLSEIIQEGSKVNQSLTQSETENYKTSMKKGGGLSLDVSNRSFRNWIRAHIGFQKNKIKEIGSTKEKRYVYKIDINEIKAKIDELLQMMKYETLYICIDEFTQIDRDISYTIQPQIAQILKQLFFNSEIIVVKIASVWNESRMQTRQINGIREGLELGNDIFTNNELNLDTMFDHNNEKAYKFFSDILVNEFLLYKKTVSDSEKEFLEKYIVDEIFSKGSFKQLVCGSQGIPRVFVKMLNTCISKINTLKQDKISVDIVYESIIDNYMNEVRQTIPYSSPICTEIDDYVRLTKNRFFFVAIHEYDRYVNFFDGLVANNALHQCPSEQLPRLLRNKYKMFFVHYGNYLECFTKNGIKKLNNDAKVGDGLLYPRIQANLIHEVDKYLIKVPDNALDKIYCSYCHKYYDNVNKQGNAKLNKCPECNKVIAYWG